MNMVDIKDNIKYYCKKIRDDSHSFIGNKNIDSGDFGPANEVNNANGTSPDDIFDSMFIKFEISNRSKIVLEVFKHLKDFFSSNSYSREFDFTSTLKEFMTTDGHDIEE